MKLLNTVTTINKDENPRGNLMNSKCICEPNLECSAKERFDELYRQMQENLRLGKQMIFLTSSKCAVNQADCIKLKLFREQMQNQK